MADYVNLNYTAAEINADLAKVHGVDAVVPEAPKDGVDYVRRDGEWQTINPDVEIVEMVGSIVKAGKITAEQMTILKNNFPTAKNYFLKTDNTTCVSCTVMNNSNIFFGLYYSTFFLNIFSVYIVPLISKSFSGGTITVNKYDFLDTNTAYTKSEIDSKIGDINTILDSINGEEV